LPRPGLLSLGLCLPGLLFAVDTPPPQNPGEAKTHVLFMGADLSIQREQKLYRVEDVVGSEFMIRVNKQEVFVPTRQRTTGVKVDYELKLSGTAVRLDGLEAGASYTPANDPRLKFDRASGAAGGAMAVQSLAQGELFRAENAAVFGLRKDPNATGNEPDPIEVALGKVQESNLAMSHSRHSVAEQADILQRELLAGNFDAMEVSFTISSPVELEDPYMVVLFKFLEPDAKAGDEGMLIYAKALDPIGPKPKYIRVREGGLPKGFKYVDSQVHIYNHGREVATNVATNRVELTRDEARQYFMAEHLGAHRRTTVPASVVPGSLPRARRAELSLDQMNQTYYAKITAEGSLAAVYADEACALLVEDAALTTLLADAFYKPALVQGKPVAGVALVRLADLMI